MGHEVSETGNRIPEYALEFSLMKRNRKNSSFKVIDLAHKTCPSIDLL